MSCQWIRRFIIIIIIETNYPYGAEDDHYAEFESLIYSVFFVCCLYSISAEQFKHTFEMSPNEST